MKGKIYTWFIQHRQNIGIFAGSVVIASGLIDIFLKQSYFSGAAWIIIGSVIIFDAKVFE